ncbi:MAG TPA: type II secretion system protein GspN [Anaeromyxobacteraceae bacterium]|nr:type II secretion system protein GspN [Anaeromyxobacteraceae bacterium]
MTVNWTVWKPRLLYGAFFLLAFLLALRFTFPVEAVMERVILEAGARGWQVEADDVSGAGFLGISAENVRAEGSDGQKLSAERVTATMRLLPLLVGRRSVAFDLRLWDGRIWGTADLSGERAVEARVDSIDLARATPLRRATGLELLGVMDGTVDLAVPEDPAAKPAGRVELSVKEAGLNGGQLRIPSLGGGLTVPRMGLGRIEAAVALAGGKGTFERLEAKGGDATFSAEGLYFVWQPRLANAPLFGKATLRFDEKYWQSPASSTLRTVAEVALASARGPDGAYGMQVYGTLGQPQMRPLAQAGPRPRLPHPEE